MWDFAQNQKLAGVSNVEEEAAELTNIMPCNWPKSCLGASDKICKKFSAAMLWLALA